MFMAGTLPRRRRLRARRSPWSARDQTRDSSGARARTAGQPATAMPWAPELFSAPVLQRLLDERRHHELAAVPYLAGFLAGEPDALVESFAGEPLLYDPIRGRIKGEA